MVAVWPRTYGTATRGSRLFWRDSGGSHMCGTARKSATVAIPGTLAAIKMKTRIYIAVILFYFFTSCGHVRIDMISEHSGFNLPETYKVIENTTESTGFAGQDFEINVILEFRKQNLTEISKHLDSLVNANPKWIKNGNNVEYFNQLNNKESETIKIDLNKGILTFKLIHI